MMLLLKSQKARFVLFGGYNTAFGYGVFTVAYLILEGTLHYIPISIACHFIAVTHSYFIQRKFVFRSSGAWPQELLRFNIAYLAILPVNLLLLWVLHELLKVPILLAQAASLIFVVILSYLSSSRFTFTESR